MGLTSQTSSGSNTLNGLIGFYMPVVMFATRLFVNASLLMKGIKRQALAG